MSRLLLRSAFNFAVAASAVLCLVTCVFWVRSYGRVEEISRGTESGQWGVRSYRSRIIFDEFYWVGDDPPPPHFVWASTPCIRSDPDAPPWHAFVNETDPDGGRTFCLAGMTWATERVTPDVPRSFSPLTITVPHWVIVAATLAPPAWAVRRARRRRKARLARARELCGSCGYDMRATPGRCPECGAVPTPRLKPGG